MGDITLQMIVDGAEWLAVVIGSFLAMYKLLKKCLDSIFKKQLEGIRTEIKDLADKVGTSDMESCKNFLVRCLADVERGEAMSETEKERFWEQYDHYIKNDGNSYIREKVEKLRKEGKI